MVGIGGFPGLIAGDMRELTWGDVEAGGRGREPRYSACPSSASDLYAVARADRDLHDLDGLVIIGASRPT